ncbi:hypothetical protein ACIA5A_12320 [Micromonospora sp. NPDC051300]|uniref:hypothetical protein n=1 Tax=Micromonospora sp. NPDC051300 TaxID=3364286 RepID=UPI003790BB46
MARRGWGGSTAAALGVAAGAGAAQLGFGYGLGIINWAPTGSVRIESAWVASLAWATWIAATSVVVGAVCAQRLRGGGDEPVGALPRLGLALAAGVGALVTVLLVAVPARSARVPDTSSPQTVAAAYAAAGLVLGVLLAAWALTTRAAATNLIATTGWLWLLAVVSVVDGVLSGRGLTTAQLGIWQISADRAGFWIRDYFYWPGALLSLGSALLIGVLAARRATRSPQARVGAAASGAAGPLLVALAYLLAVPRLAGIAAEQLSAHLIAPYAVIAGVGGSVLVAALAQRADRRAADRTPTVVPEQRHGEPDSTGPRPDVDGQPRVDGRPQTTADGPPRPGIDGQLRPTADGEQPLTTADAQAGAPKPGRRFFGRRAGRAEADSGADAETTAAVEHIVMPTEAPAGGETRATDRDATPRAGRVTTPDRDPASGPGPDVAADPEVTSRAGRAAGAQAGSAGAARTSAGRRNRAVPQQRQPGGDSSSGEPADSPDVDEPAAEPKPRRRTR